VKELYCKTLKALIVMGCFLFLGITTAEALTVSVEPNKAQREVSGKVRVHIYAEGAENLVSMGVKITFDPTVLEVVEASKYEDVEKGWLMDADGNPATTGDQFNNPAVQIDNASGTVTMIGGHLKGTSTVGLNGKVLLGWIIFRAKANGTSNIHVDLGKYHPDHPAKTFDNFVKKDGVVDEPTNVPGDLGLICVVNGACEGDTTGDNSVDFADYAKFNAAWDSSFGDSTYDPACDLDGDGIVSFSDWALFNNDWNANCPSCP